MTEKILVAALPIPGDNGAVVWDATEAAFQLARAIRAHDRSLSGADVVQLPLVDGGRGTIDFLVTHTLGSFLEVEATSASGDDIVVPLGFAGEDGKLAVIEMARAVSVAKPGDMGTTAGIGQLIQDALDEGAFSILLGHEEPLARDAGFGAAGALGVRFFDAKDREISFERASPTASSAMRIHGSQLSKIARVDVSARSFALLSSRIFLARSKSAETSKASEDYRDELARIATIIRRDTDVTPPSIDVSASGIEFGLATFLGAEVRDGLPVVLEASQIMEAVDRGEFSSFILLSPSPTECEARHVHEFLERVRQKISRRAMIFTSDSETNGAPDIEPHYVLPKVPLFQAPLLAGASPEERRRDLAMRLDKLIPTLFEQLRSKASPKERSGRRA